MKNSNITWHKTEISQSDREKLLDQKGVCIWFTGLSGSGKSTLANSVEAKLFQLGRLSYLLDGDNIRYRLNKDLGFSDEDRVENIRRISEVARLFVDAGMIVLTAFISPFISDREKARQIVGSDRFIEVFVDCEISICEQRDPKGLYKKARSGEIKNFTGISSPYERPNNPEIKLYNDNTIDVNENAVKVIEYLIKSNFIKSENSKVY